MIPDFVRKDITSRKIVSVYESHRKHNKIVDLDEIDSENFVDSLPINGYIIVGKHVMHSSLDEYLKKDFVSIRNIEFVLGAFLDLMKNYKGLVNGILLIYPQHFLLYLEANKNTMFDIMLSISRIDSRLSKVFEGKETINSIEMNKLFAFESKILHTLFNLKTNLINGFNHIALELTFADPSHENQTDPDNRIIVDLSLQLLRLAKYICKSLQMYSNKDSVSTETSALIAVRLLELYSYLKARIEAFLNQVQNKNPEKIPSQVKVVHLADFSKLSVIQTAKDFIKLHECPYSVDFPSENSWPLRKCEFPISK